VGRHGRFGDIELILVGTGADHPVPGFEVDEAGDLVARLLVSLVQPGIDLLSDLAGRQRLRLGHDLLDEGRAVGILGFPEAFAVALAVLGDDVIALGIEHVDVAGLPYLHIHDRLPQGRCALQRHAEVGHADNFAGGVADRLVGGNVPAVDHEGAATVDLAREHRLQHGIGLAVGVRRRDERADGALPILGLHVGAHAQHVAAVVHALEDGCGAADEVAHLVHDRAGCGDIGILAEPRLAGQQARKFDRGRRLRELVHRRPRYGFGAQRRRPRACQRGARDSQAVAHRILKHGLLREAHRLDALHQVVEVLDGELANLHRGGLAHLHLRDDDDAENDRQWHQQESESGAQHATAKGHAPEHNDLTQSVRAWASWMDDGIFVGTTGNILMNSLQIRYLSTGDCPGRFGQVDRPFRA
jgi:hypothetical protein